VLNTAVPSTVPLKRAGNLDDRLAWRLCRLAGQLGLFTAPVRAGPATSSGLARNERAGGPRTLSTRALDHADERLVVVDDVLLQLDDQ
jgi:hypothetical protein